jgi:hypothetical protein
MASGNIFIISWMSIFLGYETAMRKPLAIAIIAQPRMLEN